MPPNPETQALVLQHNKWGNALLRQGKLNEAMVHYRQALQLNPGDAAAHSNLGLALACQGKVSAAEAQFRHALELNPNYPEARNNLGTALRSQGKSEEALFCFREALRLNPNYAEAHYNLGNTLKDQQHFDEAVAHYLEALRLNPNDPNVHNNLGIALQSKDQLPEATTHYRQAIQLRPDHAEAHRNLGGASQGQGRVVEAMEHYEQALRFRPGFPEAHHDVALLSLLRGDFARGWPEYEWRWRQPHAGRRSFKEPLWDGSDLGGRTIVLHAEQGIGDTLQFVRFAPLVKQRGGTVILECQSPLKRILANMQGVDQLVARGDPLPHFDVQAPLLSLPGIFQTDLDTIPAAVPYLYADNSVAEQWRRELATMPGVKIGIVWQGNLAHKGDRHRSMPLTQFAPLAKVEGVHLVSLQFGDGVDQLPLLAGQFPVLDMGSRIGDFTDTAAAIKSLDLVISCDTAVAHLAGALGTAVWVALPFAPDWRWLLQRADSPWYPTMRLFRQAQRGRWEVVFSRMADELRHGNDRRNARSGLPVPQDGPLA